VWSCTIRQPADVRSNAIENTPPPAFDVSESFHRPSTIAPSAPMCWIDSTSSDNAPIVDLSLPYFARYFASVSS